MRSFFRHALCSLLLFCLFFCVSSLICAVAHNGHAFQLEALYMTTDETISCSPPTPVTQVNETLERMIAWADYTAFAAGKNYDFSWYSPNGLLAEVDEGSRDQDTDGCSWRSISPETIRGFPPGEWTVVFTYDGAISNTAKITYTPTFTPVAHGARLYGTPDYLQTDDAYGGFTYSGSSFCAPVAVSNGLMWLDDEVCNHMVDNSADRKKDQHDLIVQLGEYMGTEEDGTSVEELLNGLGAYLQGRGLHNYSISYQGWRPCPDRYFTGIHQPGLEWIQQGVEKENRVAFLNIGWYKHNGEDLQRVGGHWVTLVGYGHDGSVLDADRLIIHDPAGGNANRFSNDYALIQPLTAGQLTGSYTNLPINAAGYLEIKSGMRINDIGDTGVIDGVVRLEITKSDTVAPSVLLLLNNSRHVAH